MVPIINIPISYSLALVDNETLIIGPVDEIQMLHIDMIPLGESPWLVLLISFSNNGSYFSQQMKVTFLFML